jgi:drug/metabolite transporter (DMT)-like permease
MKVALALAVLYIVWGSTYGAMRIALGGFPPLLMAGVRFTTAGAALYGALRLRGAPPPTPRQWAHSLLVGVLLLAFGNGGVAAAEQWVASGLAAVVIASVPLWSALFAGLFGAWPTRREGIGLGIGAAGVLLLNLGGDLRGHPLGAGVLLGAAASWALGSVWSKRLSLPTGAMASAAQMLTGGAVLLVASIAHGDRATIALGPSLALAYLIVFGSLIAYSAYGFLLRTVSPALATSYAFVNPVVAVLLGVGLGHEHIEPLAIIAMAIILAGVALVIAKPASSKEG